MLSLAEAPLAPGPVPFVWGVEVLAIGVPLVVGAGIVIEGKVLRMKRQSVNWEDQLKLQMLTTFMQVLGQLTGSGFFGGLSRVDSTNENRNVADGLQQ